MAIDHLAHPVGLTTEIDVIGAGLGAGSDQLIAVELVRPDSGQDDAGARYEPTHGIQVCGVGGDDRQRFRQAGAGDDGGNLVGIAPGQGPAQFAIGAVALSQVLGDQLAGEAAGAINNKVKLSVCAHKGVSSEEASPGEPRGG